MRLQFHFDGSSRKGTEVLDTPIDSRYHYGDCLLALIELL